MYRQTFGTQTRAQLSTVFSLHCRLHDSLILAGVLAISLVGGWTGRFTGIDDSPATFGNLSRHVTEGVVEVVELHGSSWGAVAQWRFLGGSYAVISTSESDIINND